MRSLKGCWRRACAAADACTSQADNVGGLDHSRACFVVVRGLALSCHVQSHVSEEAEKGQTEKKSKGDSSREKLC